MTTEERATVRVTRRYVASAMRVFEAWVDPPRIERWITALAPQDEVVRFAVKPRVRHAFVLVVRRGREEVSYSGEYLEIIRPQRIVFTWVEPVVSKETMLVSIELSPVPSAFGGTDLLLRHERVLPSEANRTEARWSAVLDAIAAMVEPWGTQPASLR